MAVLPEIFSDPTLAEIDREMERRAVSEPRRSYLGASGLGQPCSRKTWYSIQPEIAREPFNAATLRRFDDGHAVESQMIQRLRLIPGIELWDRDEATGGQIGFKDFDGRFRGHLDGVVLGLIQAPKTPHVFECKAVNLKKFAEFRRLRDTLPEKQVLAAWDATYYAQAILYCEYLDLTRHYMVVSTPGGRDYLSCRTDANSAMAAALRMKAQRLLDAKEPPSRVSERREFWLCKFCEYRKVCHV